MQRKDVETWMKAHKLSDIGIVFNESDELGVYCELRQGILYDYTGHRVNRQANIWGYLEYVNGKPIRHAFQEEK